MPHPKRGYEVNGEQVPGVTSVVGRYKDNDKLNAWRVWCGAHHLDPQEEGRKAANIGTAVHDAIERHIKGEPFEPNPAEAYELSIEQLDCAKMAYQSWVKWNEARKPDYVALEPQLVHKGYMYGGTIDAICVLDGTLYVVDWKTSNGIYDETAMQVAAYRELWHHNGGERPDMACVVRTDKRRPNKLEQYVIDASTLDTMLCLFLKRLDLWYSDRDNLPVQWEVTKLKDIGNGKDAESKGR